MAAKLFNALFCTIVMYLRLVTGSDALLLKLTPEKCVTGMDNVVEISCLAGNVEDTAKEIMVLEISRNNQPPIAVLRHFQNISYGNDVSRQIQAEGFIDEKLGRSYLNVSLRNPRSEDTGVYTCTMYYLDETYRMTDQAVSGNFVVEKLDVKILETVLDTIKDRTTALETKERQISLQLNELDKTGSDDRGEMVDRVRRLEEKLDSLKNNGSDDRGEMMDRVRRLEEKLDSLKNNGPVSDVSAFSATTTSTLSFRNGDTIEFPRVIMMQGEGFDKSTGVFKAPRSGFYVFHLTAMMSSSGGSKIWIAIKANAKVLAKLIVGDDNSQDQSSTSCVVHLAAGDQVKAEVIGTTKGGGLYADNYTIFSGYLIHY